MNANFPDRRTTPVAANEAVFTALREKLAHEVSSSAALADLLERVNRMQQTQSRPEDFKKQFDEFVSRACSADDCIDAVRAFFPVLIDFLPSNQPQTK